MSITFEGEVTVETLNHPDDVYIYAGTTVMVWNLRCGLPVTLWRNGQALQIRVGKTTASEIREFLR